MYGLTSKLIEEFENFPAKLPGTITLNSSDFGGNQQHQTALLTLLNTMLKSLWRSLINKGKSSIVSRGCKEGLEKEILGVTQMNKGQKPTNMPRGRSYNIQQGYEWLIGEHPKPIWIDWVWNRMTLPKCQFMKWLIMRGRVQTKVRLARVMELDTTFFLCQNGEEDTSHLFCKCEFAKGVLAQISEWMQTKLEEGDVIEMGRGIIKSTTRKKRKELLAGWATACYYIWRARNLKRHNKKVQIEEIVNTIKYHCSLSIKGGKVVQYY
ncbi:hypothetical protein DM860_000996 [Cuscuta australis]|uniref:Reverse transcriptase zinc-binding domain-containing protein n=1 Tax=Cuscuta australis TaxID=267555 RepID=A0A328DTJ0_9ASTE|nr:hypothetical protein DM860_000996 [Cuscuta australis]